MAAETALEHGPPRGELEARRRRVLDALPADALALVRGARPGPAMRRFRQNNDFYYLTGLETPGSYVLLDARTADTSVYIPHRDELLERSGGPQLAAEDVDEVVTRTGVKGVAGPERLPADLARAIVKSSRPLYVPLAPEEGEWVARDSALASAAWALADPFETGSSPETRLAHALGGRFGQLEVHDLSGILDGLRLVKSEHELTLLRRAGRLCGLAVMEAMRSTAPGVYEYELEAVADFVFRQGGARGAGYAAIVAGGGNAWHGHYNANDSPLVAGDLILMDYAPDFGYYTSDIGRMWPVDGRYTAAQRELYGFVVDYHRELLARITPGVTPEEILAGAAACMRERIEATAWSHPHYRRAVEDALVFPGHLSHPVGMTVHDVGSYRGRPLEPGLVFSVDPMIWVPEDRLYVRVEDTVAVTEAGVENLTGFVPLELDDVERVLEEPGLLQYWAARR